MNIFMLIVIIFTIIVFAQLWYIMRLRTALRKIYEECLRFQGILAHYDMLIKQDEERVNNGFKKN